MDCHGVRFPLVRLFHSNLNEIGLDIAQAVHVLT